MTIDWDYTMVWFSASLLKTGRHLSTCATTMRVRFVCARIRFVTFAEMRHSLTTINSNNLAVYGQKQSVGTRFLS